MYTSIPRTNPPLTASQDGTKIFGFGAAGTIQMLDLTQAGAPLQSIGSHTEAVTSARMFTMGGRDIIASGSLDRKIKYWDVRQPQNQPIGELVLPERIYAMDYRAGPHGAQVLVAAQASRAVAVIDLRHPDVVYKTINTNLKWQIRSIACFPDATGFALGSIEGRCAIQYTEDKQVGS